ncbi:hypothetical protein ABPG74_001413 [Tetrahymena malaccensis]
MEQDSIQTHQKSIYALESPNSCFGNRFMKQNLKQQINYLQGDEDQSAEKDMVLISDDIGSNFLFEDNSQDVKQIKQLQIQNKKNLYDQIKGRIIESNLKQDDLVEQEQYMQEIKNEETQKQQDNQQNNQNDLEDKKAKFLKQSTTANVFEDEYFGEDSQKKVEKRNQFIKPETFYRLRDHHIDWNNKVFFEIFWYHLLFYLLIGPLINLVYWKRRTLLRNLMLWGISSSFFTQLLFYFFNTITITLYFAQSSQNIYLVEIIFTIIIMILRCYVISCKYATFNPDKIKLYREYILTQEFLVADFYLASWVDQDDRTLYKETYNSLQRGELDPSMFYISFFVEPSTQSQEEMAQLNENIGKHHFYTSSKYQPLCIFPLQQTQYFFGYSIYGYIIRTFTKENGRKIQLLYAMGLSIMRTMLPIVYRYIQVQNFQYDTLEIIQLTSMSINNFFGYFFSFVFLFFYIRDMRLKDYTLTQCKLMLQVKKLNLNEKKILPTIDIINPYSLKGWSIMRRICLDYGKQYILRIQAYLTIYFLQIFITSIILMLWILKVYKLDDIYPVICLFELIVTFSILMRILYLGSILNECFERFKLTLGDHKVLFLDIMRMKDVYFHDQNFLPTNFVLKKSLQKIKNALSLKKQNINDENINDYLNKLLSSISDCENELELDSRSQPFTLYGIKMTLALFQQLCIGILTLAAGFIQLYLFINKKISLN